MRSHVSKFVSNPSVLDRKYLDRGTLKSYGELVDCLILGAHIRDAAINRAIHDDVDPFVIRNEFGISFDAINKRRSRLGLSFHHTRHRYTLTYSRSKS